jgi:cell division protein FtsQ
MARRNTLNAKAVASVLPLDVRLMNGVALLVFVFALLALAAAAVRWVARSPMFTLRAITLDAALQRTNLASVRANALPRLQGNFFSVDLEASRHAFESVPWVRRAVVRRIWPDRLAVTLEEHQAAAYWQGDGNQDRLVNTHGEIFEANLGDVEDEGLATLAGPDVRSAQMLSMLRRLTPTLAPLGDDLQTLRLSSRGSWRVEFEGGATVELGRGSDDEVLSRTERFVRTLAVVATRFGSGPHALQTADLRHPDGYALRLAGVSTAPNR